MKKFLCIQVTFCLGMLCIGCVSSNSDSPTEVTGAEHADAAELKRAQKAPEKPPVAQSLSVQRDWGTVIVDAGHGGDDEGAIGVSGSQEKDITLAIAREVARGLRARGLEVIETRTEDHFLSLDRRTSVANASGASLLVSIHANSAPSPQAYGIETYYMDLASDEAALRLAERENRSGQMNGGEAPARRTGIDSLISELRMGATAQRSRELAETIHASVLSAGREYYGEDPIRDRGVRTAPFWVLVDSQIPAVLIEVGYLTSKEEEQRLRTRGFHHLIGESLASSVADFSKRVAQVVPGSGL
jgi:N-acetylmuramoyl-L-alanine amidase